MSDRGAARSGHSSLQLKLVFPAPDPTLEPLIDTGAYAPVIAALRQWSKWPERQMCLVGESGAGKSRLLTEWAREAGAPVVHGAALAEADIAEVSSLTLSALAIDDADDCSRGEALLAAMNLCRERGAALLLTGSSEPSTWALPPRDLVSRLGAIAMVRIDPPDEGVLEKRLVAACRARFMLLPPHSASYLAMRMPRSYRRIEDMALALEQAAEREGKALTRATARLALEILGDSGESV